MRAKQARRWWRFEGQRLYPRARRLLITAAGGGSNGYRLRVWKLELQKLADATTLSIEVCHFPPGTSKWNKVEHRLFSFISSNWRGEPLRDYETIVRLISGDLIRRALSTRNVGFEIHLFGAVSSTNDVACRLAEEGAREGTVVLAETQHAGRRRFGRAWSSPERANLYASVIFRPAIASSAILVFALIASLALADAVTGEGMPATVQWPNDVVMAGRRLGGTLTMAAAAGDAVQHVVLGVGVNLNVSRDALATALGAAGALATSVREAAGRPIDRNGFAASLLNRMERWHTLYTDYGPGAVLVAWNQRDALCGRLVEISGPEGVQHGRVVGVDREGRLVLESRPGVRWPVACGEITTIDGERAR